MTYPSPRHIDAAISVVDTDEFKGLMAVDRVGKCVELVAAAMAEGEARETAILISVIADIRMKSGVGAKPMLGELADAIEARIAAAEREGREAERARCAEIIERFAPGGDLGQTEGHSDDLGTTPKASISKASSAETVDLGTASFDPATSELTDNQESETASRVRGASGAQGKTEPFTSAASPASDESERNGVEAAAPSTYPPPATTKGESDAKSAHDHSVLIFGAGPVSGAAIAAEKETGNSAGRQPPHDPQNAPVESAADTISAPHSDPHQSTSQATPDAATGEAVAVMADASPSSSDDDDFRPESLSFLQNRAAIKLRPHCQQPDLCRSGTRDHCWSCKKQMAAEREAVEVV